MADDIELDAETLRRIEEEVNAQFSDQTQEESSDSPEFELDAETLRQIEQDALREAGLLEKEEPANSAEDVSFSPEELQKIEQDALLKAGISSQAAPPVKEKSVSLTQQESSSKSFRSSSQSTTSLAAAVSKAIADSETSSKSQVASHGNKQQRPRKSPSPQQKAKNVNKTQRSVPQQTIGRKSARQEPEKLSEEDDKPYRKPQPSIGKSKPKKSPVLLFVSISIGTVFLIMAILIGIGLSKKKAENNHGAKKNPDDTSKTLDKTPAKKKVPFEVKLVKEYTIEKFYDYVNKHLLRHSKYKKALDFIEKREKEHPEDAARLKALKLRIKRANGL